MCGEKQYRVFSMADKLLADITRLNPQQQDAVTTVNGPLLVLAGAGTGKTKVITTRIAYMLHKGIPPSSIVAVSFTNKAAREMRERVAGLVSDKAAKQVELSTFHSFALKLLRQNHELAGLKANFSIADERESMGLLRDTIKEQNLEEVIPAAVAAEKISQFKDKLFTEKRFEKSSKIFDRVLLKNLFDAYNRRLRLFNLVDFDDIVYLLVLLLKENPDVLKKIQSRYPYLMVDEYQDTSNNQFELVRLLAGERENICVVGDDDQSIYSWRGANPESIQEFLRAFPKCKRVTLEQNYRCSPNILNAANAVISENQNRVGKTLWSNQPNQHFLRLHTAESERDEAIFVADTIGSLRYENENYDSVAILVRANNQALPLEQVFQERNIPYIVHGGTKFFDRREIRDLVAYLKFAHNPSDLNSLFRVINMPSRGVGIATLEKIKKHFEERSDSHQTAVDILSELSHAHKGIESFLTVWRPALERLLAAHSRQATIDALRYSFENVGLRQEILETSSSMQIANFRLDLVERFFQMMAEITLEDESLSGLIDALHLDEPQFERKKDAKGAVQIMTIHSSKGLEFPNVFVVGAEENILPHERSIDTIGGVEEERRLFYVAITRAKKRLFISHCAFRQKASGSTQKEPAPSRFLGSLPIDFVKRSETDPATEEARRMEAAKRLFELFR